jgi:hypothetical protein
MVVGKILAEIQRQTVTVNVSSLTTSVIIEASTPLTVCNGTSVTYKAIPTNGGSLLLINGK